MAPTEGAGRAALGALGGLQEQPGYGKWVYPPPHLRLTAARLGGQPLPPSCVCEMGFHKEMNSPKQRPLPGGTLGRAEAHV